MAGKAQLKLDLIVDDKGSVVIKGFSDKTAKYLSDGARSVSDFTSRLFSMQNALLGLLGGYGIASLSKEFLSLAGTQRAAELQTMAAEKSMGRYTETFHKSMLTLASDLQSVSVYGDEFILNGMKMLMTYRDIGNDVMPRTSKAMVDLAALMKGDMVSAANMLGKASMGMTGELRRAGITVDATT